MAEEIAGDGTIAIIAAGERWPDETIRPAIEDWIGAGAIIQASNGIANAEARFAAEAYSAMKHCVPQLVRESRSGQELIDLGFGGDVEVALEMGSSAVVPLMRDGAYETA